MSTNDMLRAEMQDSALPVRKLVSVCFGAAAASGWWTDLHNGGPLHAYEDHDGHVPARINVGEKLMLIVSEVSEAMEGHRKSLMDDKLPERPMIEVELADALIRICDLAGGLGLDLGGAVRDKLLYNANRPDHKPENRLKENGKKY